MARGWTSVALTAAWLGLVAPAWAQPLPAPGGTSGPPPAVQAPPGPYPAAPPGMPGQPPPGSYMGLPCPPPGPPCPPQGPPPCEGPTDNTQFNVPMFHVGFDYLYWYPRKSSLPPLVTRGSITDPNAGALLAPSTRILLQGTQLEDDQLQGGRISLGIGGDASDSWSFLATGFALEQGHKGLTFGFRGTPGTDVFARPFFNTATGSEDADRFAIANTRAGFLEVSQKRHFYGGDMDLRYEHLSSENNRIHLLAGVKLLFLEESLQFNRTSLDFAGPAAGTLVTQSENLGASNRFYGGQIGAEWEFRLGPVFFLTKGKLAFGVTDSNPNLTAFTRTQSPTGITSAFNQGLFVSPSTGGVSSRTTFALAPELDFKVGFDFNDWVRLSVGYTFIGLTDAVRAGDLINRRVDPTTLAIPVAVQTVTPHATTPTTTFWAQGFDVSIRFSF
jgi:hypothetical protein